MENAALLTPADVRVIRRYVQTKYAPLSEARRAEIVADAIRRTIQRRLPELPSGMKARLTDELIRRYLVSQQREIRPEDVLDVCSELGQPESAAKSQITASIQRWIDETMPGRWTPELVANRLFPQRQDAAAGLSANMAVPGVSDWLEVPATAEQASSAPDRRPLLARVPRLAWLLGGAALAGGIMVGSLLEQANMEAPSSVPMPSAAAVPQAESAPDTGMPPGLRYQEIDEEAVIAYLRSRDSMLADEPYFSAIVDKSREFDVHPLLMFAIAGQEQGFVPRSHKNADKIANNPFNVYHSWTEYNTDIHDSAEIAARTVARRSEQRPAGSDPFHWLNMTYAEDPNWASGVKNIFDKLNSLQASPSAKP